MFEESNLGVLGRACSLATELSNNYSLPVLWGVGLEQVRWDQVTQHLTGGREEGKEGGREGGREGGKEEEREGRREGGRKREREGRYI